MVSFWPREADGLRSWGLVAVMQSVSIEILKGSLIAPVLITSKCVTGSLWQSFRHSSVILIGSVDFADWQ